MTAPTARLVALLRLHAPKLLAMLLVTAGTAAVVLHERAYAPFFTDDGFISLRYTERLLHGEGLTWTDHERVEGYSNLLWVLLCAVPGLFGVDLVAGARAVGVLCTAATLGAVVAAVRPTRPRQWAGAALAMGLLAASDSIAVWSMGGLESPLVGALLSWGVVTALAAARGEGRAMSVAAALCFGFLCWARIDGPLWALFAVLGLGLGFGRKALRLCATIGGSALAFSLLQLLFRAAYYDDYLPNTAYAKVALTDERFQTGLEHLTKSLVPLAASWLALLGCGVHGLRQPRLRGITSLHLVLAFAWSAYLLRVGGDIFPAWRLLTYVVVVAGLFAAFVLGDDLRSPVAPAALRWASALVALTALGSYADPANWAKEEHWQWDGIVVGKALGSMFKNERPLVAVDAAGAIPYASKLPAFDMLGLTDRYLAHHRPKNMGAGFMGHELGDAAYYLERAPDIICIGVPPCQFEGKFDAQKTMVQRGAFRRAYAPLQFTAGSGRRSVTAKLWVRRDGRIGIRVSPDSIVIPSYFLTAPEGAVARLRSAQIEAYLPGGTRAVLEGLRVPQGSWRCEVLAPSGSARVTLASQGRSLAAGPANTPLEFSVEQDSSVDLTLAVDAGGFFTTSGLVLRARRQ